MSIPYESSTSGDKALADLQRALAKFGCQSFGTMVDVEEGCTIVQFRWRNRTIMLKASWRGYAAALMSERTRFSRERAFAQARVSVCSVLRDWVKGQVTAVECGLMSFDAVFMPHMLLPSGERVIDRLQTEKLLPALTDESKR